MGLGAVIHREPTAATPRPFQEVLRRGRHPCQKTKGANATAHLLWPVPFAVSRKPGGSFGALDGLPARDFEAKLPSFMLNSR